LSIHSKPRFEAHLDSEAGSLAGAQNGLKKPEISRLAAKRKPLPVNL
jgi:hypothetical protein